MNGSVFFGKNQRTMRLDSVLRSTAITAKSTFFFIENNCINEITLWIRDWNEWTNLFEVYVFKIKYRAYFFNFFLSKSWRPHTVDLLLEGNLLFDIIFFFFCLFAFDARYSQDEIEKKNEWENKIMHIWWRGKIA